MFYLHTSGAMCKLVDFTTKEEQKVSRQEVMDRVTNGETIVGVVKDDSVDFGGFRFTSKGKVGQISLADYAVLTDRKYLIDEFDCEKNDINPDNVSYGKNRKVYWLCPKGHSYYITVCGRTGKRLNCPYCSHQRVLSGFNDLETYCKENNRQDLLDEWDYELNEVKLNEIAPKSNNKVYWRCPEKHHSYLKQVGSRVDGGQGCPYCCNIRTSFPEQAILYYLSKAGLNVSNRFRYGNKYEIDIYLTDYSIGIEYDGAIWHSADRRIEFDEEKNKVLSDAGINLIRLREQGCPIVESYGSEEVIVSDLDVAIKQLFSLISSKYGVSIDADVNTKRDRQTILAEYRSSKKEQSIKFTHPHIAAEWCYELNDDLTPEMFTFGSEEKVWWRCGTCNTEWRAMITARCRYKAGCTTCARYSSGGTKSRFSDYPEIESFWSKENPDMSDVLFETHTKMKICCPACNFEERVRLSNRIKSQDGLTCKNCGFHVEVQKWNRERDEYLERQKNAIDLAASFNDFLRQQGCGDLVDKCARKS